MQIGESYPLDKELFKVVKEKVYSEDKRLKDRDEEANMDPYENAQSTHTGVYYGYKDN